MSLIQKIANQSYKALCTPSGCPSKSDNVRHLIDLVNKLTAKDLNLDPKLLQDQTPYHVSSKRAPVTYIDIWDDKHFTMGVFVLRPGTRLPLHDHPHMHGLIKVVHGTCRINSFSVDNAQEGMLLEVVEKNEAIVNSSSDPVLLTPTKGNCHEFQTLGGSVAFFDILSPPYDEKQHQCNYYRLCKPIGGVQHLLRINSPDDYWTERAEYMGPPVENELVYNSED